MYPGLRHPLDIQIKIVPIYPGLGHLMDFQLNSSDESWTGRYLGYFLDLQTLGYSDMISSGKSWTGTRSGYSGT
jgi:hypothetical protein